MLFLARCRSLGRRSACFVRCRWSVNVCVRQRSLFQLTRLLASTTLRRVGVIVLSGVGTTFVCVFCECAAITILDLQGVSNPHHPCADAPLAFLHRLYSLSSDRIVRSLVGDLVRSNDIGNRLSPLPYVCSYDRWSRTRWCSAVVPKGVRFIVAFGEKTSFFLQPN